jgi:hypothetical protein
LCAIGWTVSSQDFPQCFDNSVAKMFQSGFASATTVSAMERISQSR